MENRNGLIVQAELTHADGQGERQAALKMIHRHAPGSTRQLTLGADKGSCSNVARPSPDHHPTITRGRRKLEQAVDARLADPDFMAGNRIRQLLSEMREEWTGLDRRIEALDRAFIELAREEDAAARRLASIPGIGALDATALVAAAGDASTLEKARDPGAWLRGLLVRRHRNTVVVALANKLARIAWATLRPGITFEANLAAVPAS